MHVIFKLIPWYVVPLVVLWYVIPKTSPDMLIILPIAFIALTVFFYVPNTMKKLIPVAVAFIILSTITYYYLLM